MTVIAAGLRVITRLLGGTGSAPDDSGLGLLDGMRYAIAMIAEIANGAMFIAFVTVFLLFALRIIVRSPEALAWYGSLEPGPTNATMTLRLPAPAETHVKLRNVIGLLRGSDPGLKETYVLLTAPRAQQPVPNNAETPQP